MTDAQQNIGLVQHAPPLPPAGYRYAGFSARGIAFTIDQIILLFIILILLLPVRLLLGVGSWIAWPFFPMMTLPPMFPVSLTVGWLYFALQESSRHRATFGKRICGLTVVDVRGNRINFIRATVRFFAKFISAAIMLIGFVMAAFTERHQALHDLLADTLVVKKAKESK